MIQAKENHLLLFYNFSLLRSTQKITKKVFHIETFLITVLNLFEFAARWNKNLAAQPNVIRKRKYDEKRYFVSSCFFVISKYLATHQPIKPSSPGVYFINIFVQRCFTQLFLQLCFGFGKSTKELQNKKGAHKMLMKLTTEGNFLSVVVPRDRIL